MLTAARAISYAGAGKSLTRSDEAFIYRIHGRCRPNPRRYPPRQHRCRDSVASDNASARLARLSGRFASKPAHIFVRRSRRRSVRRSPMRRSPRGITGSQRVSASAGLTVAVGAATNLCSKIVSAETMMAEEEGQRISRKGADSPRSAPRSSSEGRTRSEHKLSDTSDSERR